MKKLMCLLIVSLVGLTLASEKGSDSSLSFHALVPAPNHETGVFERGGEWFVLETKSIVTVRHVSAISAVKKPTGMTWVDGKPKATGEAEYVRITLKQSDAVVLEKSLESISNESMLVGLTLNEVFLTAGSLAGFDSSEGQVDIPKTAFNDDQMLLLYSLSDGESG